MNVDRRQWGQRLNSGKDDKGIEKKGWSVRWMEKLGVYSQAKKLKKEEGSTMANY